MCPLAARVASTAILKPVHLLCFDPLVAINAVDSGILTTPNVHDTSARFGI